ncbi:Protein sel-1-like 1 [Hondaea fermentalgiana]|uniref:Protein sel-1-like 1 n=1 Tax=Hondaea fermentalgiana TaxID=2315210 RepID=A0A2R5GMP3_9STRA|nr:Protein sel-1-like 1 [Hondaea fermentalgiana]|eukprot:GBG32157.1 Protein sel-1-like 1 [Hondaea fermentalgiana]
MARSSRPRAAEKKLREAAEKGLVEAQRALGQKLLADSTLEEAQQKKEATESGGKSDVLQEMVPTLDHRGIPTGGLRNAQETKLEIVRIRNLNRKKKKEDQLSPAEKRREGLGWLFTAAGAGNTDAMVILGNAWFQDESHRTTMERAMDITSHDALAFYKEAAEADPPHPDALYNLANLYYDGIPELLQPDGSETLRLMTIAAETCKDKSAEFWLGKYLIEGDARIDPAFEGGDIASGWDFIARAAGQGHTQAQLYAAQMLSDDPDLYSAAKGYLDAAVAQNDAEALFYCGSLCMQEEGSLMGNESVDYQRALRFFERAAVEGHAEAALNAGAMHYNGLGTPRDHLEAYRAYEHAASLGSLDAYKNIASMYFHGEGPLEKDEAVARDILQAVRDIESPLRPADSG